MVIANNVHYFVEPLKGHDLILGQPHPHILYKAAHVTPPDVTQSADMGKDNSYCSEHKSK